MSEARVGRKPQSTSSKWAYSAGLVILAALFLTRGGLASLMPLLRFAVPVIAVALVYRHFKAKITSQVMSGMHEQLRRAQEDMARRQGGGGPAQPGGQAHQVIDLCPKCGAYQGPGHRCAAKS